MARVLVVDDKAIITMQRADCIISLGHKAAGRASTVEDAGNSIPAGQKDQIFPRGLGKHTGLGLYLSREILAIAGITITENGVPGKGARFEITVPKGAWRMNPDTGNGHRGEP